MITPTTRRQLTKTLGRGLPVQIDSQRSPHQLQEALQSVTQSPLYSFVESMFPTSDQEILFAGRIEGGRLQLRLTDVDRRPWWPLTPVFQGRVEPSKAKGSLLVGKLRVSRWTLVGALVLLPVWLVLASSGQLPASSTALPLILLLKFVFDVVFSLPRTSAALINRLECCAGR